MDSLIQKPTKGDPKGGLFSQGGLYQRLKEEHEQKESKEKEKNKDLD